MLTAMMILNLLQAGCAMPGKSFSGPLPAVTPEQTALADQLKRHITALAQNILHRDMQHPNNLEKAAQYIEKQWKDAGFAPQRQTYDVNGQKASNLEIEIKGDTNDIVLVGAHYDSVHGAPGANDNGSGVAGMLALSRKLAKERFKRTLRFVAFVNEEPPYFQTDDMGSLVYARRCKDRGKRISAMLSLETIGCYSEEKGSQRYPAPFNLFYPSEGNFIGFVGNVDSADLVKRCVARFRKDVKFPCEGAALPGWIEGIGWSDHWSFWQCGYPGVMVTDTAPFRYRHYHTMQDTPDKIDYERTARVVEGIEVVLRDLLNNE
jgi:Zn-dependent M28 family amino/carboxypeptidase